MSTDAVLRRRYNVSRDEYDEMLAAQDGRCFICRRRPKAADPSLAVDHDHRTGMVRGLLCYSCNHDLLGHHGEDAAKYQRAFTYLVHPPARKLFGARFVPESIGEMLGEDIAVSLDPGRKHNG